MTSAVGDLHLGDTTNRDVDSVDERAAIAQGLLGELSARALPELKTKNRGMALKVSLKRRLLGRLFTSRRGDYRIVIRRHVWRLGAKALDLGIAEDGVLGITDDGELVRMSTWLRADGKMPIDARGQGSRFRDRLARTAQSRGCDGAVSISPIVAYGEAQRETRFNREYRNVFYLDVTGKLVFGHPGSTVDAEEWFNKALFT